MTMTGPRALVIDDDRAWQDILAEICADTGLEVDTAGSRAAAVALIQARAHRIAIVDLALQDDPTSHEGLEILDLLYQHDPGCETILLSGYTTVEVAVQALKDHHAYTCLQKENFQRNDFEEMIRRLLQSALPATATDHHPKLRVEGEGNHNTPDDTASAILVVEDDAGWREILTDILEEEGYQVRSCAGFGEVYGVLQREHFRLAVIDLALSGAAGWDRPREEPEGYRLLYAAHARKIPTIIVSGSTSPIEIERSFEERNIFAFLEKQSFDRQVFLQTVQAACADGEGAAMQLTDREREIAALVASGLTNQEIAERLIISLNTVKRHVKAIFRKLNVHSRAGVATWIRGIPGQ